VVDLAPGIGSLICPAREFVDDHTAYYDTNGLELLEFLEWTEVMDMENVVAIYSGYFLFDDEDYDAGETPWTDSSV